MILSNAVVVCTRKKTSQLTSPHHTTSKMFRTRETSNVPVHTRSQLCVLSANECANCFLAFFIIQEQQFLHYLSNLDRGVCWCGGVLGGRVQTSVRACANMDNIGDTCVCNYLSVNTPHVRFANDEIECKFAKF